MRESARLIRLGREAFEEGEYGTAGQRFGRAAAANPKAGEPLFLKAQAAFAAGAYADAVTAIRAGLELDPAWPAGAFDPKEPYGANVGAFADHLAELRRTAAANPGDPVLEFLLGYELWFVGEKAGKSMQHMSGDRAAAYLSSYFVRGKGTKATLQENARNPHLPRMLIWVSPTLTRPTGVTMRNLRRCRQLWAIRLGQLPPPSWSGVELARVVAIAGPWPARGP